MANKSLRRSRRCGFLFIGSHEAAIMSAAANKQEPMQGLPHYTWTMQDRPLRSAPVIASHFSCLPLQASRCSSSSSASSADEADCCTAGEQEKEIAPARSHSCSKLQGKPLMPSFKSLLHRSHDHLHDRRNQSCTLQESAAEVCNYPTKGSRYFRSWSSPSLHKRQSIVHLSQKPRSFSSSSQKKEGGSRGKRAPKGHVAVYVEAGKERHVVPIAYLSHPHFEALLERAKSEFGFAQQGPGLRLPCSLWELHHTLHRIRSHA